MRERISFRAFQTFYTKSRWGHQSLQTYMVPVHTVSVVTLPETFWKPTVVKWSLQNSRQHNYTQSGLTGWEPESHQPSVGEFLRENKSPHCQTEQGVCVFRYVWRMLPLYVVIVDRETQCCIKRQGNISNWKQIQIGVSLHSEAPESKPQQNL